MCPKRKESGVFICQLLSLSGYKCLKLIAGVGWRNKHCPVALSALRGTAVGRLRAVGQELTALAMLLPQQLLWAVPGVSTVPDMWFPGKNCLFLASCSLGFYSPSQTTGYSHSNSPPYGLGF